MRKNILITGKPKSGKSTLLTKVISDIPKKVGFITNEVRDNSERTGFEIETSTGRKTTLASTTFETQQKVSRYFVDTDRLESVIPEVSSFPDDDLLYLDEIGQMQLFSGKFKELVTRYLDSQNTLIATISAVYEDDFTKSIKHRKDVILIELSEETREAKEQLITALLKKIEKAKKYANEPERFAGSNSKKQLRSEHGIRNLVLQSGKWKCDCDFF